MDWHNIMNDFGPDLIKNCSTHKIELIEKISEQKVKRLAEIEAIQFEIEKEQEKEQKKNEALERLKQSGNQDIIDLLKALGLN